MMDTGAACVHTALHHQLQALAASPAMMDTGAACVHTALHHQLQALAASPALLKSTSEYSDPAILSAPPYTVLPESSSKCARVMPNLIRQAHGRSGRRSSRQVENRQAGRQAGRHAPGWSAWRSSKQVENRQAGGQAGRHAGGEAGGTAGRWRTDKQAVGQASTQASTQASSPGHQTASKPHWICRRQHYRRRHHHRQPHLRCHQTVTDVRGLWHAPTTAKQKLWAVHVTPDPHNPVAQAGQRQAGAVSRVNRLQRRIASC